MCGETGRYFPVVLNVAGGVEFGEFSCVIAVRKTESGNILRVLPGERAVCNEIAEIVEDERSTIAWEIGARRILIIDFSSEEKRVIAVAPSRIVLHLCNFDDAALRDLGILCIAEA